MRLLCRVWAVLAMHGVRTKSSSEALPNAGCDGLVSRCGNCRGRLRRHCLLLNRRHDTTSLPWSVLAVRRYELVRSPPSAMAHRATNRPIHPSIYIHSANHPTLVPGRSHAMPSAAGLPRRGHNSFTGTHTVEALAIERFHERQSRCTPARWCGWPPKPSHTAR